MMNMPRKLRRKSRQPRILAGLLAVCLLATALGQDLHQPRNHVEDRANVIPSNVERQLIAILADLEHKTGAQIIVLTIDTTAGQSIEDYTLKLAEKWKLGQKDKENGALVVVAVKDRDYRFEVGYGLEGVLPDSVVGDIGRNYFVPYFRKGDYSNGIYQGLLAVVQKVAADANVTVSGAVAPVTPRSSGQRYNGRRRMGIFGACGGVPFILMIVIFSILRGRAGHYGRWGGGGSSNWIMWMLLGSMMGGRRHYGGGSSWGSGFGGGGFGGGGFGGGSFGGGGGGGFGGGGASGSW